MSSAGGSAGSRSDWGACAMSGMRSDRSSRMIRPEQPVAARQRSDPPRAARGVMPLVTNCSITPSSTMPRAAYSAPIELADAVDDELQHAVDGLMPAMPRVAASSASSRSAVWRSSSRDQAALSASSMASTTGRRSAVRTPSSHSQPCAVRSSGRRAVSSLGAGRGESRSASVPEPSSIACALPIAGTSTPDAARPRCLGERRSSAAVSRASVGSASCHDASRRREVDGAE